MLHKSEEEVQSQHPSITSGALYYLVLIIDE